MVLPTKLHPRFLRSALILSLNSVLLGTCSEVSTTNFSLIYIDGEGMPEQKESDGSEGEGQTSRHKKIYPSTGKEKERVCDVFL